VVTSVSSHNSTVLLATDGSAKVGVRVAPGGEIGLVTGSGNSSDSAQGALRLQVFDATAVLQPGEQVVTFGGGPYAPGGPVGAVPGGGPGVGPLTTPAYVRPYANDSSLGVVGVVVTPPRRNPLFSVLPPRPRPSPSATPGKAASPNPSPSATATAGGG